MYIEPHKWWTTQSCIKIPKLKTLLEHLQNGGDFTQSGQFIEIQVNEEEKLSINNGHHRICAIVVSGRKELIQGEFKLFRTNYTRQRVCTLASLLKRVRSALDTTQCSR